MDEVDFIIFEYILMLLHNLSLIKEIV